MKKKRFLILTLASVLMTSCYSIFVKYPGIQVINEFGLYIICVHTWGCIWWWTWTNYPFRKSLEEAASEVERGGSLSDGLAHHESLYGKRLLVLLRVGEETNTLDSTLLSQADALDSELAHEVRQLNSIVEPLLILLVGAIVAFVLIAMYMPMFRLGMTIGWRLSLCKFYYICRF